LHSIFYFDQTVVIEIFNRHIITFINTIIEFFFNVCNYCCLKVVKLSNDIANSAGFFISMNITMPDKINYIIFSRKFIAKRDVIKCNTKSKIKTFILFT